MILEVNDLKSLAGGQPFIGGMGLKWENGLGFMGFPGVTLGDSCFTVFVLKQRGSANEVWAEACAHGNSLQTLSRARGPFWEGCLPTGFTSPAEGRGGTDLPDLT